jgi:hypothetical protein
MFTSPCVVLVVLVVSLIVHCLHERAPTIVVLSRLLASFSIPVPLNLPIKCVWTGVFHGCVQVGLSVQEEEPRSLPLAARFSPAPGTLLQHSLHHVLAQESPATSTTPDAVGGLAGVSRRHCCCLTGCWQHSSRGQCWAGSWAPVYSTPQHLWLASAAKCTVCGVWGQLW